MRKLFLEIGVVLLSLAVALTLIEVVLRFKNANQMNYTIEMWRYARELKSVSADPALGHEHRYNKTARLQNVPIRLNNFGLRGPEINGADHSKKRILVLGSSNTLGWGVEEGKTMTSVLQKELGDRVQVLNAGIGNYNTVRYVRLFKTKLRVLRPDIVVVHYFINDVERLEAGRGNIFLRNSELAVLVDQIVQMTRMKKFQGGGLVAYYKDIYRDDSRGFQEMTAALQELDAMAREDGFAVILAMTPESHSLKNFPYAAEQAKVKTIAGKLGWKYVDFTDALRGIPEEKLWVMPSDPHYNAVGHEIMARQLTPVVEAALVEPRRKGN